MSSQIDRSFKLAVINEESCIGCTKCLDACPFDAIAGASRQLHGVININCTGCGLCVAPCPVDCISLIDIPKPLFENARIKQLKKSRKIRLEKQKNTRFAPVPENTASAKKMLAGLLKS